MVKPGTLISVIPDRKTCCSVIKHSGLVLKEEEQQLRRNQEGLTCFYTLLLEVGAAAEVVLTVAVAPASGRLHLLQLIAPPLAGAGQGVPLRAHWARGGGRKHEQSRRRRRRKNKQTKTTLNLLEYQ